MAKTTPMMQQFKRVKAQHKDSILLFRMGDFYETFNEDAEIASRVLGIALTSRSKDEKIPMAGVPHHAVERYIAELLKAGYKVAVCDQVEDPQTAKGLVKREVVEVVTPGTSFLAQTLESKRNNYLVGLSRDPRRYGLSCVDLSTGEFTLTELTHQELADELARIQPSEVVVPQGWYEEGLNGLTSRFPEMTISPFDDWRFSFDYARETLLDHFGTVSLEGFGCEQMELGLRAAGATLGYLRENQKRSLPHITRLIPYSTADFMILDQATQRNLELLTGLREGGSEGTLIAILDHTTTPMGARLLRSWITRPLIQVERIRARLDAVQALVQNGTIRDRLRVRLKVLGDLERLAGRLGTARAHARDLIHLKQALRVVPEVRDSLSPLQGARLSHLRGQLQDLNQLVDLIEQTLVPDPPLSLTEGGLIRDGFDSSLDELRQISRHGKEWIANLEAQERQRTGIQSLKVGYNRVFGYYLEVTKANLPKLPPDYIRKQTMVNAERFITPELKEQEARVLGAEEKMSGLEYDLFMDLRKQVAEEIQSIQKNARILAEIDVLVNFADVAIRNDYVAPRLDTGSRIEIRDGRHPVVEQLLSREAFVPNDTIIDTEEEQILLITGPNMAGKSTYLRQVGLIILMAQIGSFVPVREANIGVVDRIFTRVGASDNLAKGESTFLVEMNETANILHNTTSRSLVLLDEIGRGTSTYDGLSIAWAVTEYLHNGPNTAKTLFATHYHELTELESILARVKNYNVAVREQKDQIVFLRKIVEGGCDHSYGIQVARLAGLPEEVIRRAQTILADLEATSDSHHRSPKTPPIKKEEAVYQLSLFVPQEHPVLDEIRAMDLSQITPLEALNTLFQIQQRLAQEPHRKQ